jgi:tetratricopeptide (TPR) repeat protein
MFHPPRAGGAVAKARILGLFILACTLSCALTTPPLTTPAQGGGAWRKLTSEHFDLTTDLPRSDALEALGLLEGTYRMIVSVAFRGEAGRLGRIDVILFRREKDYRALAPAGTDGYFSPELDNDPEPIPTAVMLAGLSAGNRILFQHELVHHFMRRWLPHLPVWLNEGTAEYFSTLVVDHGELLVGKPLPSVTFTTADDWTYAPPGGGYYSIPASAVPELRELLTATPAVFYAAQHPAGQEPTVLEQQRQRAFYAGAWALVHLLRNSPVYRPRFDAFINAVGRGTRPREAFDQSFASIEPSALAADLRQYVLADHVRVGALRYAADEQETRGAEETLSDAQVHLLFARLDRWRGEGLARARRHLDEALAGDPTSVGVHLWRALFFLGTGALDAAEAEIRPALLQSPQDPVLLRTRVRIEVARITGGHFSRDALDSFSTRLAAVARTAAELDSVARARSILARDDGLPFAERAIKEEPYCWRCQDTYAHLLGQTGSFDEAIAAETRALELLPEGSREGKALLAWLQIVEEGARTKAAKPAPAAP